MTDKAEADLPDADACPTGTATVTVAATNAFESTVTIATATPTPGGNIQEVKEIMQDTFAVTVAATLFWASLIGSFLWLGLGVLWAPFAAAISAWQSYKRGSEIWWYYGLIGGIYSLFLLFPWIYLSIRLSGRRVPITLIVTGYITLYVVWFVGLVNVFYLNTGTFRTPSAIFLLALYGSGAIAILSAAGLLWALRRHTNQERLQSSSTHYRHKFYHFAYLTPFVFAAALPFLFRGGI